MKAELARLKPQLPRDVEIKPFYDQSLLVRSVGRLGARRHPHRPRALGADPLRLPAQLGDDARGHAGHPGDVLVTFVAMWIVGLSFDLMTLGGVAAAIGLVIDDAIVVVENIYTHMAARRVASRGRAQRDRARSPARSSARRSRRWSSSCRWRC